MLKSLLTPLQKWLLKRGQCVGCGMPLDQANQKKHTLGDLAVCKCGRSYFHLKDGSWRRALQSEVK